MPGVPGEEDVSVEPDNLEDFDNQEEPDLTIDHHTLLDNSLTMAARAIKAIDLPEFSGDRTSDKLGPRAWVTRIDQLRSIVNQGAPAEQPRWSDEATASYAALALKGKAGQWYNILAEERSAPTTWDGENGLKSVFLARFHHVCTLAEESAIEDSLTQEPNEAVKDFYDRVKSGTLTLMENFATLENVPASLVAATKLKEVQELSRSDAYQFMVKRRFIQGLLKPIKTQVVVQDLTKLADIVSFASRVEASFANDKKASVPPPAINAIQREPPEDKKEDAGSSLDAFIELIKGRLGERRKPRTNTSAQLKCWYCNIPGHREADCYKKKGDDRRNVHNPRPGSKRASESKQANEIQGQVDTLNW